MKATHGGFEVKVPHDAEWHLAYSAILPPGVVTSERGFAAVIHQTMGRS